MNKTELPPLIVSPTRKTSAQIIREARDAINLKAVARPGVRTVQTKRPFTPRDGQRTLFNGRVPGDRPPSSFTLSPLNFDTSDGRSRDETCRLPFISSASNWLQRHPYRALSLSKLPAVDEGPARRRSLPQTNAPALILEERAAEDPLLLSSEIKGKPLLEPIRGPHIRPVELPPSRKRSLSKRVGVQRDWKHTPEVPQETLEPSQEERRTPTPKPQIDQALFFEEKISPLLDEISRAAKCPGIDDSVLAELVEKLHQTLAAEGLLGRHFRYRNDVLRTVFRLVDREHGPLLAAVAEVLLTLKVSGTNLTSVCKLVFKVTRNDSNDLLFLDGDLLDMFLEAVACISVLEQPEACIYGYGALKFLTMNSLIVGRLLQRGILELIVLHIKLIISHKHENGELPEQIVYALVQLTGTLRHISSCDRAFPAILITGAVMQVCELLAHLCDDSDVTANVVRVLSIVSTQEECCSAAASHSLIYPAAVAALQKHSKNPAIVVRLAYALGNMMANSNEARWKLFTVNRFAETMLELLAEYLQKDRNEQLNDIDDHISSPSGSSEDVMVKVGPVLARSKTCSTILVSILRHKTIEESEELVLSVLATLNNLTFYARSHPPSSFNMELAECLCDTMSMDHVEGLIETVRVFGNLTHFREVREILTHKEVLEILVEMLDCDSRELVYVCTGVLVNMMSDESRRRIFQQENGILRLIDVLQYFGYGDWQLCSLACQVVWNYCASAPDVQEALGEHTEHLLHVLEEFLDDESYFGNPEIYGQWEQDQQEVIYQLWEDFANVAEKLCNRIEEKSSLPLVLNNIDAQ